jgi:hypothetical protein
MPHNICLFDNERNTYSYHTIPDSEPIEIPQRNKPIDTMAATTLYVGNPNDDPKETISNKRIHFLKY